jgi:ABC-type phosphate transport system substrate-binding protein
MKIINKILVITLASMSTLCFADVAVIVNTANNDTIDTKLIKKIYLGKAKSFPNGNKVKVFSLTTSQADTEYFRQKALKKSNSQFKSYWSKLAFTGKGTPATELDSAEDIITAVKKNPNAIGFINSADVNVDVKVVKNY